MRSLFAITLGLALVGAACSSDEKGGATTVVATDSKCTPEKTSFAAGKLTFEAKNEGSKVTELYVYAKGDKIMGEVENVGPGTSRSLTVDLKAGEYELACKPGQTGKGIRAAITVTGSGGEQGASEAVDREHEVTATDFAFSGMDGFTGKAGETVEFYLQNDGTVEHEFEVLDPDGKALGEVEPVAAGKKGEGEITFGDAGDYTYVCGIAGHEEQGMKGTFTVEEA
jgi:uncharacterized cupredoxin-like copper-binding protein